MGWLRDLFPSKRAAQHEQVEDPVLGVLRLDDDGNWWEAQLEINGKTIGFKIGGDTVPAPALIAHAHHIVRSFVDFDKMVSDFLADQAAQMEPAASEIRQLVMEDVCLFWPDRPDDGMIFFNGRDEFRVWRCDYVNRKPTGLGFDD